MYGLKMPAKYWDLVSMYSGPLGPLKGWGKLANYLLAKWSRIVPMHQWKVHLKYRAMLLFPSGLLGLGGAADTMVWGGYLQGGGNKNLRAHTY